LVRSSQPSVICVPPATNVFYKQRGFELLEAQPWTCLVDRGGAPSASALPARAGMAGALAATVAAADVWAPFKS
jgi:hypothetical protein